jgi:hypothetical protein
MGRVKRAGYIIEWWMGDHLPKHVHVYKNGREIAKVEISGLLVLKGRINARLMKILQALIDEGEI